MASGNYRSHGANVVAVCFSTGKWIVSLVVERFVARQPDGIPTAAVYGSVVRQQNTVFEVSADFF